jgi:phage terminase small subunit
VTRGWADQIRLFARELGLTPSARAGLHMEISPFSSRIEDEIGLPPRLRVAGDG